MGSRARRVGGPLLLVLALGCGTNSAAERVVLPPGASFAAVTDTLVAHGVVGNRLWFKLLARARGSDRAVRAGVYDFAPDALGVEGARHPRGGRGSGDPVHGARGAHHPGGRRARAGEAGDPGGIGARRRPRQRRGLDHPRLSRAVVRGVPAAGDILAAPRNDGARAGPSDGGRVSRGVEARVGRASRGTGVEPCPAGDVRLDRRGRGAGRRRARDDRGRVPQQAEDRHGAAGRSHGACTRCFSQPGSGGPGSTPRTTSSARPTTPTCIRVCRRARSTRPASGVSRRR